MSKTFRKTMLRAGQTFHSPDGGVTVTPERLAGWSKTFKRMRAAKQVIPMHWDHGNTLEDFKPITMSELKAKKTRSAKNTVGHLKDFEVSEDGQSAVVEFITLDDAATEAMEKNKVSLSPVILDAWTDGAKNQYTDAITHMDMVDHAVDYSQGPAEAVTDAICCSLRMSLSQSKPAKVYRMAMPDDEDEGDDAGQPFGDNAGNEGDEPEAPEIGEATISKTLEMLAKIDIVLPGDTGSANFIDRLYTALLTVVAMEGNDMAEEQQEENQVVDPQIQTMSLQAKQALAYGERQHRATVTASLDDLLKSGRCTPAEYKDRKEAVGSIRLSLDDKGEPQSSAVEAWIESRQPVPEGTFWDSDEKLRRLSLEAVEQPAIAKSTKEEEDALVERMTSR